MSWMGMSCLCVLALLTACSSVPAKTPVQIPARQEAVTSKPDLVFIPPSPSISPEEWLAKHNAEARVEQAAQMLAIMNNASLLDPGKDLAGTGQLGKPLVFRLPKAPGLQRLTVNPETAQQVLVEVYEHGASEGDRFWSIYNGTGYYLLRTDLYDTYLRLTPLVGEARYALQLAALEVTGTLDEVSRRQGQGFEGSRRSGRVFSDRGQALANVRISVQGIYAHTPFAAETLSDAEGRFSFDVLPHVVPLRIEASLEAYSTRVQERILTGRDGGFSIYFGDGKEETDIHLYPESLSGRRK